MFFGKKFAYHPVKNPTGDAQADQKLDKLRRTKSRSLFLLVFLLLVTYIVLNVLLESDDNNWLLFYNGGGGDDSSRSISIISDKDDKVSSLTTEAPPLVFTLSNAKLYKSQIAKNSTMGTLSNITLTLTNNESLSTTVSNLFPSSSSESNVNAITAAPTISPLHSVPLSSTHPPQNVVTIIEQDKIVCKVPILEPFHSSIKHLIKAPESVNCTADYPLLFESLPNDKIIKPMSEAIEAVEYKSCCYRIVYRKDVNKSKNPDSGHRTSTECYQMSLKNPTFISKPEHDFLAIFCQKEQNNSTSDEKIVDMHPIVHLKPPVEKRIEEYYKMVASTPQLQYAPKNRSLLEDEKMNVVILGIDAVSHMNFLRTMPTSYSFLMNNLSAVEMLGFNKIGDNTYPNLVAVLTSLNTSQMSSCENHGFFDECPFIWKKYASQGFRTSFGEDSTWMGIFNYLKNGFKNPPTDYYLRPFGNAADTLIGTNKRMNAKLCQGSRLSFQILLDYMKKLAWTMGFDKRYFQLIWATSLTHDYLNDGQLGDKHLQSTLQWFRNQGYLNKTVFILMSDHGIRWGDIRDYLQGQLEERLPFLYFVLPLEFKQKYSRAYQNLLKNRNRLTTPYDLHETLKDLLDLNMLDEEIIAKREKELETVINLPKGISQFILIPAKRTCDMAGIEGHYCTCHNSKTVPTNNTVVEQAANYVVYSINDIISQFSECAYLTLKRVKRASLQVEFNKWTTYQLLLETQPGGATFESSVKKDEKGGWHVSGTISRTNLYGNQSHCVEMKDIKLYCYCLDLLMDKDADNKV